MSQNKLIFFIVAGVLIVLAVIGVMSLSSGGSNSVIKAPSSLSVWVVGDDSAGYSDIIAGFKKANPSYATTDIQVTKFATEKDYESTLTNMMADGNSPDIFMVPSNEGNTVFSGKTLDIPSSVINTDDFSKNFNKLFDTLLIEQKQKDASGNNITVSGLR